VIGFVFKTLFGVILAQYRGDLANHQLLSIGFRTLFTSNVAAVTEVRSASIGLVLHAQHIFAAFASELQLPICSNNFIVASYTSKQI